MELRARFSGSFCVLRRDRDRGTDEEDGLELLTHARLVRDLGDLL